MFAIRSYDGFEFHVHSFDLQDYHQIGFEKFPEFNRANQCAVPLGPIYKFTYYWDNDHMYDADISYF